MDRKIHREKPTNFNKESRILYSSYPVHLLKRARLIIWSAWTLYHTNQSEYSYKISVFVLHLQISDDPNAINPQISYTISIVYIIHALTSFRRHPPIYSLHRPHSSYEPHLQASATQQSAQRNGSMPEHIRNQEWTPSLGRQPKAIRYRIIADHGLKKRTQISTIQSETTHAP